MSDTYRKCDGCNREMDAHTDEWFVLGKGRFYMGPHIGDRHICPPCVDRTMAMLIETTRPPPLPAPRTQHFERLTPPPKTSNPGPGIDRTRPLPTTKPSDGAIRPIFSFWQLFFGR